MKKQCTVIMTLALIMIGSVFADKVNLGELSADTAWFTHFDMEKFAGSKIHDLAIARGLDEKCELSKKHLDISPIDDIKSVTIYGTGENPKNGVLILKGNMNSAKLIRIAAKQPEYSSNQYNGLVLHIWKGRDGSSKAGCFFDEQTLLISRNKNILIKAIDTLSGISGNLSQSDYVTSEDAIFQIFISDASKLSEKDQRLVFLSNVSQTLLAVGQKGEEVFGEIIMQADTQDNALLLEQMVQGIIAMIQMQASKDYPQLLSAVKKVEVDVDGLNVITSLVLDATEMDKFIAANKDMIKQVCNQLPMGCAGF